MKKLLGVVAGLVLASSVAATPAIAQDARPMSFGVAAGLSVPMGDFGDGWDSGFHVTGLLGFTPATMPFGLRFEVGYHSFGGKEVSPGLELDDVRIIPITGNVVLAIPTQGGVRPYIIGGIGLYNIGNGESETEFGINAGAGLEFPLSGFNTFLEARFHSIFTENENTNFVPLSFGIRF